MSDVLIRPMALRTMARIRLLLIPFAGAGPSAFRAFAAALPDAIEPWGLTLAGRESLARSAPCRDWDQTIAAAAQAAETLPAGAFAIYGHSLGALIGLDLARRIERAGPLRLIHVFVAARPSPSAPAPETARLLASDDETLLARMTEAYGDPPASLRDPEIRDYALPILRADLTLLGARPKSGPAGLSTPLTAIIGRDDPATPQSAVESWRAETSGPFDVETLAAGHYFLDRPEAAQAVARRLV